MCQVPVCFLFFGRRWKRPSIHPSIASCGTTASPSTTSSVSLLVCSSVCLSVLPTHTVAKPLPLINSQPSPSLSLFPCACVYIVCVCLSVWVACSQAPTPDRQTDSIKGAGESSASAVCVCVCIPYCMAVCLSVCLWQSGWVGVTCARNDGGL